MYWPTKLYISFSRFFDGSAQIPGLLGVRVVSSFRRTDGYLATKPEVQKRPQFHRYSFDDCSCQMHLSFISSCTREKVGASFLLATSYAVRSLLLLAVAGGGGFGGRFAGVLHLDNELCAEED